MIHVIFILVFMGYLYSIIRTDQVMRAWQIGKDFSFGPKSIKGWRIFLIFGLAFCILVYLLIVFGVME
jgi:hypothetical protein